MKIKTITNGIKEKFDEEVNQVNDELKAKFTQTHLTVLNGNIVYTAVLFYE